MFMSGFNDDLKNIKIKDLAIFIIVSFLILYVLSRLTQGIINQKWFYVIILFYILFKLKNSLVDFNEDFSIVFLSIVM